MIPTTTTQRRFNVLTAASAATTTAMQTDAEAKTTTANATITTETADSSKIIKNDLRYVPVTMKSDGNILAGAIGTAAIPIPTGAMLQVVSDNGISNNGVNSTAIASIVSPLATTTINSTQRAPINVVLTGSAVMQTGPPGLPNSILIHNQKQFVNNVAPNTTTLQYQYKQQQLKHCSATTATLLPVLDQEMVKQIVVGNGPSPRTLLKVQTPSREIIQHKSVLLQPKQRKQHQKNIHFSPQQQQRQLQAKNSPALLVSKLLNQQKIPHTISESNKITSTSDMATKIKLTQPMDIETTVTNFSHNESHAVDIKVVDASKVEANLATASSKTVIATGSANIEQPTKDTTNSVNLLQLTNAVQVITIDEDENENNDKLDIKCNLSPLSKDKLKSMVNLKNYVNVLNKLKTHLSQKLSKNPRIKRSKSLNHTNSMRHSTRDVNSTERRRSTAFDTNSICLNVDVIVNERSAEIKSSTQQENKTSEEHDAFDVDLNDDQLVVLVDDKSIYEDKQQSEFSGNENSLHNGKIKEDNFEDDKVIRVFHKKVEIKSEPNVLMKYEKESKKLEIKSEAISVSQSPQQLTLSVKEIPIKEISTENDLKSESLNEHNTDNNSIESMHIKIKQSSKSRDDGVYIATVKDEERVKNISSEIEDQLDKSLLICDEQIQISSSSSSSICSTNNCSHPELKYANIKNNNTSNNNNKNGNNNVIQWLPMHKFKQNSMSTPHSFSSETKSVLNALSNYNMLTWKERIGTANGTPMRFHLNEFNLLEIHERCPPRYRIHTTYEKPICEREIKNTSVDDEEGDPLLYLCRRCNCHGPAVDFLAPGFCSLDCLKRESRKRSRAGGNTRKRLRKEPVSGINTCVVTTTARPTTSLISAEDSEKNLVKKQFRWSTYLRGKYNNNVAAPVDHFLNPFPTGPNPFEVGMKLEAIDPENCSLFCVCTVVEIQGYRLKLKFDGYDSMYNFWVNADSMDIFPPGWCAKTNRILQPPKEVDSSKFNWLTYLNKQKSQPAHRQIFTHLNSSALPPRNPFQIGMHLEAEDLNDTGKLCVATVADVLEDRIRVHFDGWDNCYDYWVDINSPYIHPCGWHQGRQQLIVPPEFENSSFHWPTYITQQKSGIAAPNEFFEAREAIDFRPQMKLEVVDPRNPSLIRPATVQTRKGHRVKLHLDCWPLEYCFWVEDDSPDMHPIGWCDATGHDLEPPPGYNMRPVQRRCTTNGCRGIGNAKCFFLNTHSTRDCCPYAPENWRQKVEKPPRVSLDKIVRLPSALTNIKAIPVERPNQNQQTNAIQSTQNVATVKPTQHYMNEKQILDRIQMLDNINTRCGSIKLLPIKQEVLEESIQIINAPLTDIDTNELVIAKQFLCDYGPRLRQNYDIWQRNLCFDRSYVKHNPLHWSTEETAQFVGRILNCENTADYFKREDVDGSAFLMLQQSDLTELLGMRLGPAVKLFTHILQLRTIVARKQERTFTSFSGSSDDGNH